MSDDNDQDKATAGCLAIIGLLALWAFILGLNGWLFDYVLKSIAGRDVPFYADVIAGFFTSAYLPTVTVLCWVLQLAGFEAPFIAPFFHQ